MIKIRLYIISGGEIFSNVETPFEKAITFNLKTHEYSIVDFIGDSEIGEYPENRTCFGGTLFSHYFFMCGGRSDENIVYNDFWRLDLKTFKWKKLNIVIFL